MQNAPQVPCEAPPCCGTVAGTNLSKFKPAAWHPNQWKQFLDRFEAAAANNAFDRKPLGPIGSLLKLVDEQWAVAVEHALGGAFNTW